MVNYNNGKIYKIVALNAPPNEKVYIGSTTKKLLCQRMHKHRADYRQWKDGKIKFKVASFDLFDKYGLENCVIILVELVNAQSKDELLLKEREHILLALTKYHQYKHQKNEKNTKLITEHLIKRKIKNTKKNMP